MSFLFCFVLVSFWTIESKAHEQATYKCRCRLSGVTCMDSYHQADRFFDVVETIYIRVNSDTKDFARERAGNICNQIGQAMLFSGSQAVIVRCNKL